MAKMPPSRNAASTETRYITPIRLWSSVKSQERDAAAVRQVVVVGAWTYRRRLVGEPVRRSAGFAIAGPNPGMLGLVLPLSEALDVFDQRRELLVLVGRAAELARRRAASRSGSPGRSSPRGRGSTRGGRRPTWRRCRWPRACSRAADRRTRGRACRGPARSGPVLGRAVDASGTARSRCSCRAVAPTSA